MKKAAAVTGVALGLLLPAGSAFGVAGEPVRGVSWAPRESCAHSPSRHGCPRVSRIVVVGRGSRQLARASVIPPGFACADRAYAPSVTRKGRPLGRRKAQARAVNECRTGVGVSYQELYAMLKRFEHRWINLNTKRVTHVGGGRISATTRFRCRSRRLKAYESEAFAYSVVKGVGYVGTNRRYDNLRCG